MKKLIMKRLIKKVITEIEKTEYWDARVLRLESLYFMDSLILEYEYDEKHNVVICFKRCYDINFSHWIEYKKTPDYAHLTIGQIPYFIQKIDVSNKNEKLEFKINAWPLDLYILCDDIDVSYKDTIENI